MDLSSREAGNLSINKGHKAKGVHPSRVAGVMPRRVLGVLSGRVDPMPGQVSSADGVF